MLTDEEGRVLSEFGVRMVKLFKMGPEDFVCSCSQTAGCAQGFQSQNIVNLFHHLKSLIKTQH